MKETPKYTTSERYDVLTIMSKATKMAFATKKIPKPMETPSYPGCFVFRSPS